MYVRKRNKPKSAEQNVDHMGVLGEQEEITRLGDYQVMESIGKGAFGQVYRGLSLVNAETVAIKRVWLHNVPLSERDAIEMEIKLLQGLAHPNIVAYRDALRSESHLNIVLEFVENGSLASLLSKFKGAIPEPLVGHYIAQVLLGLSYLHQQGVIHRDIKGANILSTKEGLVKLTDFGVATKLNESRKSASVVGTPYWMAPEIIEMTGQQSPACDIWSVGCTVIELLTGKPPYFDLQQMAALFRIVQDDHPPLPDNVSAACTSFLLECFQKDPNRRIDANGLLKHPWIKEHGQKNMANADLNTDVNGRLPSGRPVSGEKAEDAKTDDNSSEDWDMDMEDDDIDVARVLKPTLANNDTTNVNIVPASGANLNKWEENDDSDDWDDFDMKSQTINNKKGVAVVNKVAPSKSKNKKLSAFANTNMIADSFDALNKYKESDDDDDEYDFDLMKLPNATDDVAKWDTDVDEDDDIFNNINFDDDDDTVSTHLTDFNKYLQQLNVKTSETQLVEVVTKLTLLVHEFSHELGPSVTARGVIPIVELLEKSTPKVVLALLKLINTIIPENEKFQQNVVLVGLIPIVLKLASQAYGTTIRQEAASFIRHLCSSSDYSRKMFVSCGGIPALVAFLYEDVMENRDLVLNAIDCIFYIFEITSSPKNDFCRIFCKFNLLSPLSFTLLSLHSNSLSLDENTRYDGSAPLADKIPHTVIPVNKGIIKVCDSQLQSYVTKICTILEWFSNGDPSVKQNFTPVSGDVLQVLVSLVPTLPQESLIIILRALRSLSMDPKVLDVLAEAKAIPTLIPLLDHPHGEIVTQSLMIMYYMCCLYPQRQVEAAKYGIIPHLVRFIRSKHPRNQFAYPILFTMAKSELARAHLRKNNCMQLFIDVFDDSYWRTTALDAMKDWLVADIVRVDFFFRSSANMRKLVDVFTTTRKVDQLCQVIKNLMFFFRCESISTVFGQHEYVINDIVSKLTSITASTGRRSILDMVMALMTNEKSRSKFLTHPLFLNTLKDLSADSEYPVIAGVATKILTDYAHDVDIATKFLDEQKENENKRLDKEKRHALIEEKRKAARTLTT